MSADLFATLTSVSRPRDPLAAPTPGPWNVTLSGLGATVWAGDERAPVIIADRGREPTDIADAYLISAAHDMCDAMDPETLEAIADEIDCFEHSARAAGLRSLAKRQRAAIAKVEGRS